MKEKKRKGVLPVRDEIDLFTFSELLEESSYWLQKEPENSRIIRLMQQKVNKLAEGSSNKDLRFLASFLSAYVDQLWNNLAVDFTYQSGNPGREILMTLIRRIGKELELLAVKIREKGDYNLILLRLSSEYQETLSEIYRKEDVIRNVAVTIGKVTDYGKVPAELRKFGQVVEQSGAITQSRYTLAGGCPSDYFFDADKMMSKPEFVEVLSDYYAAIIKKSEIEHKIDKLAFIEKEVGTIGILPLMGLILSKTGKDGVIVRLQKQVNIGKIKSSRGTEPKQGEIVAILSDVATAGEGITEAAAAIRSRGAEVHSAFVLYDREQGAKEMLKKSDVELHAVATYSELRRFGLVPAEKGPLLMNQIPMPPTLLSKYSTEKKTKEV